MADAPRILYLIDISSYFYRAFHAIRGLSTSKGFPTNAAYGVTNMLLKVIKERQPHYLALVFDSKGPTQRHRDFPDYKAHRPPMPEELVMQLPYIQKIIDGFRLPALRQEGFEADDLICTLVHRARAQGFRVEIITGDKDLLPLVQEGVDMWDPMKEVRYDPAAIREKYGLTPEELVEVRALAGDASDNIPGVPGIGEKTALKLIAAYHSLENLLAHVDEIKQKSLRDQLKRTCRPGPPEPPPHRAGVSRCPWTVDLEALQPGPPDREGLRRLFVELEFNKLVKELGFDTRPPETCLLVKTQEDLAPGGRGNPGRRDMGLFFLHGGAAPGHGAPGRGGPGLAGRGGGLRPLWPGAADGGRLAGPGAPVVRPGGGQGGGRPEGGQLDRRPFRPGARRPRRRHPPGLLPAGPGPL